jgi:hypothetical protein
MALRKLAPFAIICPINGGGFNLLTSKGSQEVPKL